MPLDTRIPLRKLEVLCLVVELGSMSRAAEQLHVAQPVISAHIKSLESRIGAKLLLRRGNRMLTTEAGEAAYAWAADVLMRSREMARKIEGLADGSRGAAVIASSMTVGSYLLPPVLVDFRAARPQSHITLMTSNSEDAAMAVDAGQCDFAVLISDDPLLASQHVTAVHLGNEDVVLVGPTAGPLRQAGTRYAGELAGLPLVSSPAHLTRQGVVNRQLTRAGVTDLDIVIELGHAEAMKRAVRGGLGLAFLFRSSVSDELARGELAEVPLLDAHLTAPVMLLHRRDKTFTVMQQDLIAAIADAIGTTLGAPEMPHADGVPLPSG